MLITVLAGIHERVSSPMLVWRSISLIANLVSSGQRLVLVGASVAGTITETTA